MKFNTNINFILKRKIKCMDLVNTFLFFLKKKHEVFLIIIFDQVTFLNYNMNVKLINV